MREFDKIDAEVFLFGFVIGCLLCTLVVFSIVVL
jgi:hypothetical protein